MFCWKILSCKTRLRVNLSCLQLIRETHAQTSHAVNASLLLLLVLLFRKAQLQQITADFFKNMKYGVFVANLLCMPKIAILAIFRVFSFVVAFHVNFSTTDT